MRWSLFDRKKLFLTAARTIVSITRRYYEQDDESVLPRDHQFRRIEYGRKRVCYLDEHPLMRSVRQFANTKLLYFGVR